MGMGRQPSVWSSAQLPGSANVLCFSQNLSLVLSEPGNDNICLTKSFPAGSARLARCPAQAVRSLPCKQVLWWGSNASHTDPEGTVHRKYPCHSDEGKEMQPRLRLFSQGPIFLCWHLQGQSGVSLLLRDRLMERGGVSSSCVLSQG